MTPTILRHVRALGHSVFEKGRYNLNIIAVRSPDPISGAMDDALVVAYRDGGGAWICRWWPATVDPMPGYLRQPIHQDGTAILCPGQYRGAYELGLHRGRRALVQVGPVRVWRDDDRDTVLDWHGDIAEGFFAINVHDRAGPMDTASAGCIVLDRAHLPAVLALAGRAVAEWGPRLTLTVVEQLVV